MRDFVFSCVFVGVVVGGVFVGGVFVGGCSVLSVVNDEIACEGDAACPRAHVCDDGYCVIDVGGGGNEGGEGEEGEGEGEEGEGEEGEGEGEEGEGEGGDPQGAILDLEISLLPPCRAMGGTAIFPVVDDDRPTCTFRLRNVTAARIDLLAIAVSGGGYATSDAPALPASIGPGDTVLLGFSTVVGAGEDVSVGVLSLVGALGDGVFGLAAVRSGVVALVADGSCAAFANSDVCGVALVNGSGATADVVAVDVVAEDGAASDAYAVDGLGAPLSVGSAPQLFTVQQLGDERAELRVRIAGVSGVLAMTLGSP